MDLSDFMDGDKPISYEQAKKYFAQDPSQKWVTLCFKFCNCILNLESDLHGSHIIRWAAYVAGAILVLMTELGVRFEDSISILV